MVAGHIASRNAQRITEGYQEFVFRRFGASEVILHDREPGFMPDFLQAFTKIAGQKQRGAMAYRPEANGTSERVF